jgi:hypothetical protein
MITIYTFFKAGRLNVVPNVHNKQGFQPEGWKPFPVKVEIISKLEPE